MPSPLIAVVEDEPEIRELLEELLTSEGYRTVAWDSATGAWRLIGDVQPDLVILDLGLGEAGAGEALLARVEEDEATQAIPVIVCSGDIDVLFKREAQFRAHGHGVVMKPFHVDALLHAITARIGPGVTGTLEHGG